MNGIPVVKRPEGTSRIIAVGSTAVICLDKNHEDQVVKGPFQYHYDGCAEDVIENRRFDEEFSRLCMEREKAIYQILPKHLYLLDCVAITDHGIHFPYIRLGNLREYLLKNNKNLKNELRYQWIKMATSSISLVHSYGIIHADISARNFLVADDLTLKLCDFSGSGLHGQDSLVSEEDRYCIMPQSPRSIQTDLFALGCLAFEIMTGLRPYDEIHDSDYEEIERRYREGQFPSLNEIPCREIIDKCWHLKYSNVNQMLSDLDGEKNPTKTAKG